AARLRLSYRRGARAIAGLAVVLDFLALGHASPRPEREEAVRGIRRSIDLDAADGWPPFASYPAARSNRRRLVNGSAFSARSRTLRKTLVELLVHAVSPNATVVEFKYSGWASSSRPAHLFLSDVFSKRHL